MAVENHTPDDEDLWAWGLILLFLVSFTSLFLWCITPY